MCVSAPARLYGQTVFTESVHRQCFPEFHITHGAQVACHGVFSILVLCASVNVCVGL